MLPLSAGLIVSSALEPPRLHGRVGEAQWRALAWHV